MIIRNIALTIMLSLAFPSVASENDFHQKVVTLYSFEPHTLSSEQIEAKSADLDEFWKEIKSSPDKYLPLLRNELSNKNNSAYFYYDGSKLLLSISDEKSDQVLALNSIPKTNLQSIQHTDYLRTVHWFAVNGFDTTNAALRILDYPDFKAFIVQHSLTLGQDYSLIYMLFPMPDEKFVAALSHRLHVEESTSSQKSILLALWYSMSPEARATIFEYSIDKSKSHETIEYAKSLMRRKGAVGRAFTLSGVSELKQERQKIMTRLSDEALHEFESITEKLLAKQ